MRSKEGENRNYKTSCGLAWKVHSVTSIASYWSKKVIKRSPKSGDRQTVFAICWEEQQRICGQFKSTKNRYSLFFFWSRLKKLTIKRLQLSKFKLLNNYRLEVQYQFVNKAWHLMKMSKLKLKHLKMRVLRGAVESTL